MAASDVAAPVKLVNSIANEKIVPSADADDGVCPFEPSVWGDFFVNCTNDISKACYISILHIHMCTLMEHFFSA